MAVPPGWARVIGATILALFAFHYTAFYGLFQGFESDDDDAVGNPGLLVAFGRNDMTAVPGPVSTMGQVAIHTCLIGIVIPILFGVLKLSYHWIWISLSDSYAPRWAGLVRRRWRRDQRAGIKGRAYGGSLLPDPLWRYPDGAMEPAQFLESSAQTRRRCARNHVRRLLRGRRWLESQAVAPELVGKEVVLQRLALVSQGPEREAANGGLTPRVLLRKWTDHRGLDLEDAPLCVEAEIKGGSTVLLPARSAVDTPTLERQTAAQVVRLNGLHGKAVRYDICTGHIFVQVRATSS